MLLCALPTTLATHRGATRTNNQTNAHARQDAESPTTTQLVELRVFVRKGGKLKYELDGLRWKSSYADDGSGEGPPPGIFTM